MQQSTSASQPMPFEPRVVMTADKEPGLHVDFLDPNKADCAIGQGELKGQYAYLEYEPRQDFCDIQDLGDLPNIDLDEKVEIFNKCTQKVEREISLKVLVLCPCVVATQSVYAIDLSSTIVEDLTGHQCQLCSCCTLLSDDKMYLRYDISPIYQKLPKYKASAVVHFNLEHSEYGSKTSRRLLLDARTRPSKSLLTNAEDEAEFKLPVPSTQLTRKKWVLTSGHFNGIALNPGHRQLVDYWIRRQRQTLKRWYGKTLTSKNRKDVSQRWRKRLLARPRIENDQSGTIGSDIIESEEESVGTIEA